MLPENNKMGLLWHWNNVGYRVVTMYPAVLKPFSLQG